ncbi:MAG: nitroreductase family protein [Deltaproteobacteria bacterium]|nr:nitroreductase family protein [Deltaproteobacteria bacterium]MBW2297086.1 nitroreductase family protein [Deltaproteobacteria bacterium]MBW2634306.1 nitroreductase family protein [Deltaproteobacteria bacterium]MBW2676935.1 nitroreductase family protein [Deltaproteobacteria bacterium]
MALITIDQDKCLKDGICVSECPSRLLSMESMDICPAPTPDFETYCLACGHCVAVCPTQAFSLEWLKPADCTPMIKNLRVTPEQAEQFLIGRRSIRTFRQKIVAKPILEKLLAVACAAPSAKNQQPWHWIVVQQPAEVRRLAGMVIDWMRGVIEAYPQAAAERGFPRVVAAWDGGQERICRGAPHIIIAHGDKNWGFGAEDCALAISLLDLYATSFGLGSCWGGYFYSAINAHRPLFEDLGLPDGHKAFGAIMVGYPKFKYRRIPLRNNPDVVWKP